MILAQIRMLTLRHPTLLNNSNFDDYLIQPVLKILHKYFKFFSELCNGSGVNSRIKVTLWPFVFCYFPPSHLNFSLSCLCVVRSKLLPFLMRCLMLQSIKVLQLLTSARTCWLRYLPGRQNLIVVSANMTDVSSTDCSSALCADCWNFSRLCQI